MQSSFEERKPFKKRLITVSVTADQDAEFERMKRELKLTTDGSLIKQALAELAHRLWGDDDASIGTEIQR